MAWLPYKIFSCTSSLTIANKIAGHLDIELGRSTLLSFSDGEFQTAFDESVRGCHVFIIQSTNPARRESYGAAAYD